jgi:hypothetical protein
MKRLAFVLAVAITATAVFAVAAAGAVKSAKSTVTIGSGSGNEFKGKVSSPQKACRANRKVTLYKKPYSYEEGEAEGVGTDRTDAAGNWTIEGAFVAGLYYARVTSALVHVNGQPIRCSIDLSITMRY